MLLKPWLLFALTQHQWLGWKENVTAIVIALGSNLALLKEEMTNCQLETHSPPGIVDNFECSTSLSLLVASPKVAMWLVALINGVPSSFTVFMEHLWLPAILPPCLEAFSGIISNMHTSMCTR